MIDTRKLLFVRKGDSTSTPMHIKASTSTPAVPEKCSPANPVPNISTHEHDSYEDEGDEIMGDEELIALLRSHGGMALFTAEQEAARRKKSEEETEQGELTGVSIESSLHSVDQCVDEKKAFSVLPAADPTPRFPPKNRLHH